MSLKRRLESDEAVIADVAREVDNLKRFKVGDRTITMREVPLPRSAARGFPFAAPPPPQPTIAPRVNVNVQTPRNTWQDVREGERQAYLSGYRVRLPRISNPSIAVAPSSGGYRGRAAYLKKIGYKPKKKRTAAQLASKASLARARKSASKGGSKIPKKYLFKAEKKANRSLSYNSWMKQTKARLLKALNSRPKSVLAACLARS